MADFSPVLSTLWSNVCLFFCFVLFCFFNELNEKIFTFKEIMEIKILCSNNNKTTLSKSSTL